MRTLSDIKAEELDPSEILMLGIAGATAVIVVITEMILPRVL